MVFLCNGNNPALLFYLSYTLMQGFCILDSYRERLTIFGASCKKDIHPKYLVATLLQPVLPVQPLRETIEMDVQ